MATEKISPILKEEYFSAFSDMITKKAYDALISKIENRCNWIVRELICKPQNIDIEWWDFANCDYEYECDGSFDLSPRSEYVDFTGIFKCNSTKAKVFVEEDNLDPYFPVEFIWMDDKDIIDRVKKGVERLEAKKKAAEEMKAAKKKANQSKKLEMIQSIKDVLTPEQLKYIKFK